MPVPTLISELSTTPGSNSPSGADSPSVLDDHQRTAYAFIKTLSDEKAAAADAVLLTGNQTIAGTKTFSSPIAGSVTGSAASVTGTVAIANGGTGQTTAAAAIAALFGTRADIASAATVDLSSAASSININGTTTITAFTVAAGRLIFVRFNASLTLTNNASIVTQTGANIVTTAGDTCVLRATAANVVEVLSYTPAVLNQQTTRSMVRVNTANGYGSTNTTIRRFSTVVTNQGTDVTYADSATLGALFTINVSGVYGLSYVDNFVAAADLGISLNSTQLTTAIGSITAADRIAEASTSGTSTRSCCAVTIYLPAGSLIRPHTGGGTNSVAATTQFTITRIA